MISSEAYNDITEARKNYTLTAKGFDLKKVI